MWMLFRFSLNRWKRASKAEEEFWKKHRHDLNSNLKEWWNKYLNENFSITPSFFEGKKVLEVGCGPQGVIGFIEKATFKVGVDPLRFDSGSPHCVCVGEALPFSSDFFDVVVCLNVIDHVIEPEKVIREISRVLAPGGVLLLSIHTFPRYVNRVLDLISLYMDKPHPHHLTAFQIDLLCSMYGLQILYRNYKRILASSFKAAVGKLLLVKENFITAKKI